MKAFKTLVAVVLCTALSTSVFAQAQPKKEKMKDHKCTEACHKDGKCTMAHGEKGHKCTDACKKKEEKKKA